LKIIYTQHELIEWRQSLTMPTSSIGFVPTMGALHLGHISLIERALEENDAVVVSIFVNPAQFNDSNDFLHYPKNIEGDLEMLKDYARLVIFLPATSEMYPSPEKEQFHSGLLTSTLEAKLRPGHFDGVITIIRKLFNSVRAHRVYFGEKDFQQLAVIKSWVILEKRSELIIPCPTIRESDGLAMSSRNQRLSPEMRKEAPFIFEVLQTAKAQVDTQSPAEMEVWIRSVFLERPLFRLDYFEIIDGNTFAPLAEWSDSSLPMAMIAVFLGEIRLIDNIALTEQSA
jgi:pantoate--beta-alanine ligase